jgi:hypothetical protein
VDCPKKGETFCLDGGYCITDDDKNIESKKNSPCSRSDDEHEHGGKGEKMRIYEENVIMTG